MHGSVDAHQHFWRLERGDYAWLTPELAPLYRDFEPADLAPLLSAAGVERSVVVQAAPTPEETRFLLSMAKTTSFIAGVVGWVDLAAPDACDELTTLALDAGLVGIRPMLQDLAEPDWILRDELAPALEQLADLGLVFDALVRPVHLPYLRRLLDRHPRLRVVVDHGAKPDIASGEFEPWAREIAGLAADSDACCKLSGLLTEAAEPSLDGIRPWAEHLLTTFGPERLLWGSDWPVLGLASDYAEWWEISQRLLDPLAEEERRAVLGGNASRCYGLA